MTSKAGRRGISLTVVGDPGVGKTSLILAAVKQDCPEHPVPTLPPTSLPAELCPDAVPCLVMDTSSRLEDRLTLEQQCLKADVVLLLWSKDDDECFKRLSSHWLPELRRMGVSAPIILVGSRHDLAPHQGGHHHHQNHQGGQQPHELSQLMLQYKEVEVCLECSAKKLQFVEEVFYYAVKAVIHPTAPLYDTVTGTLQQPCTNALKRIFMLCDQDGDGLLSDEELNAFQVQVWKTPLKRSELDGIKRVAADKMRESVVANGLTLAGFVTLHCLFVEKGRLETTWAVLRSFGYGDDVRLRDDILDQAAFPGRSPDQPVVLTAHARHFLSSVFRRFDRDQDEALSPDEQRAMFSTAPCNPWDAPGELGPDAVLAETRARAAPGALTHSGFLAKWAYMALRDPRATFANALYLGFVGEASQLLAISSKRRSGGGGGGGGGATGVGAPGKDDAAGRPVVQCCVFGAPGAGKTALLRGLVGLAPLGDPEGGPPGSNDDAVAQIEAVDLDGSSSQDLLGPSSASKGPAVAVGAVDVADLSTVLVMRKVEPRQAAVLAGEPPGSGSASSSPSRSQQAPPPGFPGAECLPPREFFATCDVAVFVFDSSSPESFREAHRQLRAVASVSGDTLPCLLVAAKDDLGMSQALMEESRAACEALAMQPPTAVSMRLGESQCIYARIAEAAQQAHRHIPETDSLKALREYHKTLRRCLLAAGAGITAWAAAYTLYSWWTGKGAKDTGGTGRG